MKDWYNKSDCEHLAAYHAYYPVAVAAMLWCQVPPDQVQDELNSATQTNTRGVLSHPYIPCFSVRCRVLHDAIESGALPASRENGRVTDEHIAPERRYVSRENLKTWIAKEHPADKPPFLFDAVERSTHSAINADAFRALQVDRDAMQTRLEKSMEQLAKTKQDMNAMAGERDTLRTMVDNQAAPGKKAETTYLNIIGGLLDLMDGTTPGGQKKSVYGSQAAIISALMAYHRGKQGIAPSTLEQKFAEANRSIKAT